LLGQTHNQRSAAFQTTVCIYLLACGASRSQFEVLNHAGFSLSYTSAIKKIKALGQERLQEIIGLAHRHAFMIIWDNLNIAFRVAEQRHDSNDHFDNGTTATLVPLWGVNYGDLALSLKPQRDTRLPVLSFGPSDLVPSLQQTTDLETAHLWHIEDIFYNAFPELRKRLSSTIPPPPSFLCIPVHKTEQYPLPAMHVDESSLDGTLKVVDSIMRNTLKMSAEDIEKHGLVMCAGDQLTISLLDKVSPSMSVVTHEILTSQNIKASASRRDDSDILDNVGRYTYGQLGLFHVKIAADRMVANEYWGTANSKSPWSLWKVNSLLGRKAITAGWKAKQLPPFRPTWELITRLTLPAHILDAFRIYCGNDNLEQWTRHVKDRQTVCDVAKVIYMKLCSARRVSELRQLPSSKRDVPLENIMLFLTDALTLREFGAAIKRGDVGSVVNILSFWMVMFRGTGKMPKYADALFYLVTSLKQMNPVLR
jgi:hypothetical protein